MANKVHGNSRFDPCLVQIGKSLTDLGRQTPD